MIFNLVIFIVILVLAAIVRLTSFAKRDPAVKLEPLPVATTSPDNGEVASPSGSMEPAVLGLTLESKNPETSDLRVYESTKLNFMTMVAPGLFIEDDIVRYQPEESASSDTAPHCRFTAITTPPSSVVAEKTLDEFDLPLVEYKKLRTTTSDPTAIETIYILKSEENTPKLQLNCTKNWQQSEAFYTILRSVRFN